MMPHDTEPLEFPSHAYSQFLRGIDHFVRNPLTVLGNSADICRTTQHDPNLFNEFSDIIHTTIDRISHIMSYPSFFHDYSHFKHTSFEPYQIMYDCIKLYQVHLGDYELSVQLNIDPLKKRLIIQHQAAFFHLFSAILGQTHLRQSSDRPLSISGSIVSTQLCLRFENVAAINCQSSYIKQLLHDLSAECSAIRSDSLELRLNTIGP